MDKEHLEFHIVENGYFGTLATVLDLMGQTIAKRGFQDEDAALLEPADGELLYLQAHHTIRAT